MEALQGYLRINHSIHFTTLNILEPESFYNTMRWRSLWSMMTTDGRVMQIMTARARQE
jgi:hypothetical protein